MHKFLLAGIVTVMALVPTAASAGIITFDLSYSGAVFGNGATATGHVSFDDAVLPDGPFNGGNISAAALGVVDWSLTVSGAATGNGTFTLADLELVPAQKDGWVWVLSGPLDLSADLVGQAAFVDFNWCAGTGSCGNPLAPGGSDTFTIRTSGETGDALKLTSMAAVPEPATLSLVAGGLLAGVLRRRRRLAA